MANQRKKVTRRAALAGLGGLAAASQVGGPPGAGEAHAQEPFVFRPPEEAVPVNGKAGPGLEPFDDAMLKIMDRHGIPGAALAIARDGKLRLAKGYGWANVSTGLAVQPEALFGLASVSKSITAVATLLLVEQGKFGLDDSVFALLDHIKPPRGARVDPRLRLVTVRQCLNHSGGWNRMVRGDPINWEPQISRTLRVRPPVSPAQFLTFTMALPLDFDPGTSAEYSNVGYVALGEVIARVSGQTYERFVLENVLKPMGITRPRLHPREGKYLPGEARRYLAGALTYLPPMRLPMVDATGGWSCSAVDLVRFLTNLDGSRGKPLLADRTRRLMWEPPPPPLRPRANGTWFGLGWDGVLANGPAVTYYKDGSYQGIRTFMKRLPTGVNWALLYNAGMEFDPLDMRIAASTIHEVRQLVERFEKYPDVDLFEEYP